MTALGIDVAPGPGGHGSAGASAADGGRCGNWQRRPWLPSSGNWRALIGTCRRCRCPRHAGPGLMQGAGADLTGHQPGVAVAGSATDRPAASNLVEHSPVTCANRSHSGMEVGFLLSKLSFAVG